MGKTKAYTKRKERAPRRTKEQIQYEKEDKELAREVHKETITQLAETDAVSAYKELMKLSTYELDSDGYPTSPSVRALEQLELKLMYAINNELDIINDSIEWDGPALLNRVSETAKRISDITEKKVKMQKDLQDGKIAMLDKIIKMAEPKDKKNTNINVIGGTVSVDSNTGKKFEWTLIDPKDITPKEGE